MRTIGAIGVILAAGGWIPLQAQDTRAPEPSTADRRKAEKELRSVYKDDYGAKDPALRRKLAKELLAQGKAIKDPSVDQYVLLAEAADLAAEAGDAALAIDALDALARRYAVDEFALKVDALNQAGKKARTPARLKATAYQALKIAEQALAADAYEPASKALDAAKSMARRAGDAIIARHAADRGKAVSTLKRSFDKIRKSAAALLKDPEDAAANQAVGSFRCFTKGDWEGGLPLLAKGSDRALADLATMDLGGPKDSEAVVAVADGWYDRASKERGVEKIHLQIRARTWYEKAEKDAALLVRAKIKKRLRELESVTAGPRAENLLGLIDPKTDGLVGTWTVDQGALITAEAPHSQLEIPYVPPQEYDLTLEVERQKGTGFLLVGLAFGDTQWDVVLDANGLASFHKIGDATYTENETVRKGDPLFVQGKPSTVVCSVRRDQVAITVDGERIIDWKADYGRIRIISAWKLKNKNSLYLGSIRSEFRLRRITLTPLFGQGRRLR